MERKEVKQNNNAAEELNKAYPGTAMVESLKIHASRPIGFCFGIAYRNSYNIWIACTSGHFLANLLIPLKSVNNFMFRIQRQLQSDHTDNLKKIACSSYDFKTPFIVEVFSYVMDIVKI